ncbi:MAG TPA: hypothetical protein VJJ26_03475 [Candidatus Babeliales bacterium]|nr:hypothetical protein [Candidatus Babeliales bacterium]
MSYNTKLLSIATFLIFATTSLVAQQPGNTEILTHLKSVKAKVESNLKDSREMAQSSPEGVFGMKIINEFFREAKDLQTILINKYVKPQFELICNKMLTLDQLPEDDDLFTRVTNYDENGNMTGKTNDEVYYLNVPTVIVNMDPKLKKALRQLFTPIYTKHHEEYCQNNPRGTLATMTTQNQIDEIFAEVLNMICSNNCTPSICPLLEMVDAKIKELEAQA